MTLLEDIQNSAIDGKSDLGMLLRKCRLLAARLGSQPLEDWLVWESNGYPDSIQVPEYRVWSLQLKGHFSGSFGSVLRNAPIPTVMIPEEARKSYDRYECRLSIANVQDTIASMKNRGMVQVSTQDLAVALGTKVYQNMNCVQAWAEFSAVHFVELVNTVRNRILDFSLALWKQEPLAGETGSSPTHGVGASIVNQTFYTAVYGGSANLVGSAHDSSVSVRIVKNDFASLETVLHENGIKTEDIAQLRTAITADEPPSSPQAFGPKVSAWIAAMTEKAANGTWTVGLSVAGNLLAKAMAKYYGL
ncbi:MAG: hypothetical protein L0Z46_09060 [Nitrospiraceae bacterium]|nr:hypothetical protein [Nitrospiraceae bacterium]